MRFLDATAISTASRPSVAPNPDPPRSQRPPHTRSKRRAPAAGMSTRRREFRRRIAHAPFVDSGQASIQLYLRP